MNQAMQQLREGLQLLEEVGGAVYFPASGGLLVETVNAPPMYDVERLHALGWRGTNTRWTYAA